MVTRYGLLVVVVVVVVVLFFFFNLIVVGNLCFAIVVGTATCFGSVDTHTQNQTPKSIVQYRMHWQRSKTESSIIIVKATAGKRLHHVFFYRIVRIFS